MAVNDFRYLIIGGSTKCGTTSLFEYLAAHPQVNASLKKESRFFWTNIYPIAKTEVSFQDGIEKYDSIFTASKKTVVRLEATPDYMYSAETAKLFRQHINNCKFIFILRKPEDRILSWYKFSLQLNLISPQTTFDEFVREQLNSSKPDAVQYQRAVEQCRYGSYLQPWYDLFTGENIFVGWYDDLSNNPQQLMAGICKFAGLESSFYEGFDFKIYNKSVQVKNADSFNRYRNFRRNLRRILKSIPLGKIIKSMLSPVNKMYMKNISSGDDWSGTEMSAETARQLQQFLESDKALLQKLTNKKTPW